jgi:mannose-6-phosphate isomerase-like protein (cupin superfamily)
VEDGDMTKKIRRVVTGHDENGKSVFVSDGPAPREVSFPGMKGSGITAVWTTDNGMTAVPGSEDPTPNMTTFVPGHGGTRFLVTVFAAASKTPAKRKGPPPTAEELRAALPGLAESMEAESVGMHTTDTVDYDIIISGDLWLELDDGVEVHLKPGDIVVQTGTRHAWHNRSPKPCVMYSVLVGTPRQ